MQPDDVIAKFARLTAQQSVKPAKIRVIHYGLGTIGVQALRLVLERGDIEVVAAIDAHPARAGRDLGQIADLGRDMGITATYDLEAILAAAADVVLHAPEGGLTAAYPEILRAVANHKNVISTCPELAFPWTGYPDISRKLDHQARQNGVGILGMAAEPGFAISALPLLLAAACQRIRSVRLTRVSAVPPERLELRTKLGIGLSPEGFAKGTGNGSIAGHAGLRESLFLIADTLGYRLDKIKETIEPMAAPERLKTAYFLIERHHVMGLRQRALALSGGREVVVLEMETSLVARDPRDEITIDGEPPIRVVIPGGIQGEPAAAAIMVNCIPAVVRGGAVGLLSIRDLPIAPYRYPGLQPVTPPPPTSP